MGVYFCAKSRRGKLGYDWPCQREQCTQSIPSNLHECKRYFRRASRAHRFRSRGFQFHVRLKRKKVLTIIVSRTNCTRHLGFTLRTPCSRRHRDTWYYTALKKDKRGGIPDRASKHQLLTHHLILFFLSTSIQWLPPFHIHYLSTFLTPPRPHPYSELHRPLT